MNYRPYGNTGKNVSEVGFGAWQLGNAADWAPMTDNEAISLVHHALDDGCNYFDTAPGYGRGRSETLLGQALLGRRHDVVINTKCGHGADGTSDFSPDSIRKSVESSLKRLQTDYLDSVLLHNPSFEALNGASPQFEALARLQDEGKILAYGASVDSSREMFEVIRTSKSQVMEVLFNIFSQETSLAFDEAQAKNVALVIKVPLDSGWLSGKYSRTSEFSGIRNRWSTDVIERRGALVEALSAIVGDEATLLEAALSYILAQSAVTSVIPGCKSIQQWDSNRQAAYKGLSEQTVKGIREFWQVKLADDPLPW